MRIAVGMLVCLGGLSAAWANDPEQSNPPPGGAPPAAPAGASSPTTDPAKANAPAAAASAPTPAAAPPANAAAQPAKTTELTDEEKNYLSHGYKLQMRGDQKYFCHREAKTGTRFAETICRTAQQMAATSRNSKDFTNDIQRPSGNQPGK